MQLKKGKCFKTKLPMQRIFCLVVYILLNVTFMGFLSKKLREINFSPENWHYKVISRNVSQMKGFHDFSTI